MNIREINKKIKEITRETEFNIDKEIYRGDYYTKNNLRNIVYSGFYKNKPAILKFYNDPRITDEPISLETFLKNNKSKILTAPKLYKKRIISPHSGWFIAEKMPKDYKRYKTPLKKEDREEFLEIFLEYKKSFSKKPTRELFLSEKLSADNFHIFRINRWFELAQKKEADRLLGGKKIFLDERFLKLFERATLEIKKEFEGRKMIWCHGHFKPHEIFTNKEKDKYYLIDFAHTRMFPEGYELAFIIWSDYLIKSEKWNMSYEKWKNGVDEWIAYIENLAKKLKFKDYKKLVRMSLVERLLGTILADITASDRPDKEKNKGIALMDGLLEDLL